MIKDSNPRSLITDFTRVHKINGFTVISQAILIALFALAFELNTFQYLFLVFDVSAAIIFGIVFYFTNIGLSNKYYYLPYFVLPLNIVSAVVVIPSLAPAVFFLFFILSTSFVLMYGGGKIELYLLFASILLLIYTFFFSSLTFTQAVFFSLWMLASLAMFAYRDSFFAREIYNQRREAREMSQLARQLQEARKKDKALEEMKLDFVSMAAHELRTPITSIRSYLSVLQDEIEETLSAEHQQFLRRVNISTDQLMALMENLLSVARIERGRVTLDIQPVQWEKEVDEAIARFAERAKEKGLLLKFIRPKKPLPPVAVDPLRVDEIINNLLTNAITYTYQGEVEVSTEVDEEQQKVITHIRDTGQGIPKEALPYLFTKFYRVSGPLEEGSKGTGLGLYISKKLVELLKGEVWVKSELGKGATFSFSLPIWKHGSTRTNLRI